MSQKNKNAEKSGVKKTHLPIPEVKEVKGAPATRVVNLRYKSCCGCGCTTSRYSREVPYDHPAKDGDNVDRHGGLKDSDKYLGDA